MIFGKHPYYKNIFPSKKKNKNNPWRPRVTPHMNYPDQLHEQYDHGLVGMP